MIGEGHKKLYILHTVSFCHQLVHDKLRDRLISSKEIEKLDALRKVGLLAMVFIIVLRLGSSSC